jgi:substrate-binding family protein/regulatory GntR family protein
MTATSDPIEALLRRVRKDASSSCHQQIYQLIAGAVQDGLVLAGARLPAERRIAELTGVSRTTVRIALESLVHQGFVKKRTGSGVFVAPLPLRRGIGCALAANPYGRSPWQVLLTQPLLHEIRTRRHEEAVYLLGSEGDCAQLERDVARGRIHGLLSTVLLQPLTGPLPVVYCSVHQQTYCVNIDYGAMVNQGVEHLVAQGCRELALFVYDYDVEQRRLATEAFRSALQSRDLPFRLGRIVGVEAPGTGCGPEEAGRRGLARLWDSRKHPDGIVLTDDWHGLGAMQALMERGIHIPQQVRLATHVNTGYELPLPCPVTRLQVDPRDLARAMLDLLEEVWAGRATDACQVLVAPKLCRRAEVS